MAFENLSNKFSAVFKRLKSKGKLSEADVKSAMREVKLALLEADVNYNIVKDFVDETTKRAVGVSVLESLTPAQQVIKIVNEELKNLMGGEAEGIKFPSNPPCVVMMCGLQGSGKTTQSVKLAKYFKDKKHRPLLVACDVYRPAAIEQLKTVGSKADIPVFEMGKANPVKIAKKALNHAKDYGNDLVILDTAGRLHIDEILMDELSEIKKEVNPNEILLVVDSMTGQDAVNIAEAFNDKLGVSGVILTKLDGDARGGAALSILAATGKPIKFVGIGEKINDFEQFHPDRMASRILGMGDMLTLIEKAEEEIDEKKAKELAVKLKKNSFDFNDLYDQLQQIQKMGSIKDIIKMIPGVSGKIKEENLNGGDDKLKRMGSIILSMTKEEREKPSVINPSRKRRIAAGSGTNVPEVNLLLKQFEQMRKMLKQTGAKGRRKFNKFLPNMGGFG